MYATHGSVLYSNAYPYRVLVVDDEPSQRRLEREILQAPKFAVSEASNGEEALTALKTQTFDAVLLDRRMPDMTGDEVCRRIRAEHPDSLLPIIMVTGSSSAEDLAACLNAGANEFLRKPYAPLELTALVDSAVQHKRIVDQLDSAESVLFAMARLVEGKDSNTGDHCSRLAHNAVAFGREIGLGAEDLLALRRGGVLHDIGKIGIPDSILLKPAALTDAEWVVMRQHTIIGARLCQPLKSMRLTVPIIEAHHERYDGGGYPHGLKGREIPLLARVFQLVDIYDALSNPRPYKPALQRDQVLAILREEAERGWRDPELAQLFIHLLRNRPELFKVPDDHADDLGAGLFSDIQHTGALSWDRRPPETKA